MRFIKKAFHIYVECKSKKKSSEIWYFQCLSRNLSNITFVYYHNKNQFFTNARKNKDEKVFFVAILDVDLDYNNLNLSINARKEVIDQFLKKDIEVYLSSRCWENWLVNHFEEFNVFTSNGTKIPIPNYEKKREWYTTNYQILNESLPLAVRRSHELRSKQYDNQLIDFDTGTLPSYDDNKIVLLIIEHFNPISYVDLFISKLFYENGTPIEFSSEISSQRL